MTAPSIANFKSPTAVVLMNSTTGLPFVTSIGGTTAIGSMGLACANFSSPRAIITFDPVLGTPTI